MTDSKITDLAALTGANLATGDVLEVSDISDTSMDASGTSKKITGDELAKGLATTLGVVGRDKIWDTKGDLAVATGADAAAKLAVGADRKVLAADSTQSTGLAWVDTGGLATYGDGSDGTVTFDGTTTILGIAPASSTYTLTRDLFLAAGTINSGVSIITQGYRIFCSGTLTNNGTIKYNGGNAVNNGGVTALNNAAASLSNAAVGGNGGAGATGAGTAGGSVTASYGGAGGAGGTTGGNAGGAAGTVTAPTAAQGSVRTLPWAVIGMLTAGNRVFLNLTGGGGGGGGGGDGTQLSGAGGAGGGVLIVAARAFAGTGAIQARGGNGANGQAGNASGGGGGGGGLAIVVSSSVVSGAISGQTIDANGGTKGTKAGTGSDGSNGSSGTVILLAA